MPVSTLNAACWDSSLPRSQVNDRRSCSGSVRHRRRERVLHRDRAVAGERGAVLRARDDAVAVLAWQVDQHREPGRALDQRADRGALQADEQVAFPVPGDGSVLGLGGPFADHHLGRDVRPGLLAGPGPRDPQRPPGAQAGDQLALQRAAALDVERLVDRLVADPHGLIIGEVDPEPVRDLLRAPPLHPPAIPTVGLVAALPRRALRADGSTIRRPDDAGEPVLHVVAEPLVAWPAWRPSVAGHAARRATARSTPCTRAATSASTRCGAAPARSSTGSDRAAGRSPAHRDPAPARARCPHARRTTGSGPTRVGGQTRVHAASVTEPPEPNRG